MIHRPELQEFWFPDELLGHTELDLNAVVSQRDSFMTHHRSPDEEVQQKCQIFTHRSANVEKNNKQLTYHLGKRMYKLCLNMST